jgi:hypothetical protein
MISNVGLAIDLHGLFDILNGKVVAAVAFKAHVFPARDDTRVGQTVGQMHVL